MYIKMLLQLLKKVFICTTVVFNMQYQGIVEVMDSNPIQAWNNFSAFSDYVDDADDRQLCKSARLLPIRCPGYINYKHRPYNKVMQMYQKITNS